MSPGVVVCWCGGGGCFLTNNNTPPTKKISYFGFVGWVVAILQCLDNQFRLLF
jgi:hypothetical protein